MAILEVKVDVASCALSSTTGITHQWTHCQSVVTHGTAEEEAEDKAEEEGRQREDKNGRAKDDQRTHSG